MASLDLRLAIIERQLHVHPPRLVTVEGGVDNEPQFACSVENRWDREPGESVEAFTARVMGLATQARLPFVILGGIGPIDHVEPAIFEPSPEDID